MLGAHQAENAATAVAVADGLRERGEAINEGAIADGLAHARIRGRLEVMGQRPLVVVDGAHNAESAEALARALKDYFRWQRCYFVLGVTADKDLDGIGAALAPMAELFACCRFENPRSRDGAAIAEQLSAFGRPAIAYEDVATALQATLSEAGPEDLVCVTGSLYVVAEAREAVLGAGATLG
jgi:dihydrofolate synthase/folylpolyglutamate synthase